MQRWFLPFLSTLLLLQGCVAAALVGTAAVGTKV
ncbi:TPA: osmotically-inducible protein OsmY, partial [Escherichia coli]|nr:osmotically-inducible protein OsmY [Escherichia coli]HAX7147429.1 osmotically-inducible protein OsmY [Escherichia coli]HAX7229316.1 osmotically-inducible protein OsmY [Escherichia coli]HBB8948129.1 osmotically-inducible protein OsmY [Escherichia coli]